MHARCQEIMTGQARLAGRERPRPALLDVVADVPGLLLPWADVEAALAGHVRIRGWADDAGAAGTLRSAPVTGRRIRCRLDLTSHDRRKMHLDGWKWRGKPGRLEIWCTTLTYAATGTGSRVHHELVAPSADGKPHVHGDGTAHAGVGVRE